MIPIKSHKINKHPPVIIKIPTPHKNYKDLKPLIMIKLMHSVIKSLWAQKHLLKMHKIFYFNLKNQDSLSLINQKSHPIKDLKNKAPISAQMMTIKLMKSAHLKKVKSMIIISLSKPPNYTTLIVKLSNTMTPKSKQFYQSNQTKYSIKFIQTKK